MHGSRKFKCAHCGADITVTILNPGDLTKCVSCGFAQPIPVTLEKADFFESLPRAAATAVANGTVPVSEVREMVAGLDRYDIVCGSLTLIAWAVPGYLFALQFSIGPSQWQLAAIADMMVLVAMNRLRLQRLWGFMPTLTMILCGVQFSSRISALFGQRDHYSVEINSLILLAILFTLLTMTDRVDRIRDYRSVIIAAIATTVLTSLFLIGALFAIGAVLVIHNFLIRFAPAALLAQFLGALAPVAAFWLASDILTLYAVIGVVRTLHKRIEPLEVTVSENRGD